MLIGEINRVTPYSNSNENPYLSDQTTSISSSRCNQWVQQAQINNRSDDDYGNLSDIDSHKVTYPVDTSCGFTAK